MITTYKFIDSLSKIYIQSIIVVTDTRARKKVRKTDSGSSFYYHSDDILTIAITIYYH